MAPDAGWVRYGMAFALVGTAAVLTGCLLPGTSPGLQADAEGMQASFKYVGTDERECAQYRIVPRPGMVAPAVSFVWDPGKGRFSTDQEDCIPGVRAVPEDG